MKAEPIQLIAWKITANLKAFNTFAARLQIYHT